MIYCLEIEESGEYPWGLFLKLRLKENQQAKIAPVAKEYGMKKAGPKTFVREKNGPGFSLSVISGAADMRP